MYGYIPKQLIFLNKYIAIELLFTIEKLWNYGKKTISTVTKKMVLQRKL